MKSVLHTDESRPVPDVDKRFRRAYEHAAIGMALLDREAAIIDANPAFTDVFLPPEGESTGTSFASLVSKDDCERFVSAYQLLVENGISKVDEKLVCVNADEMPLQTLVKAVFRQFVIVLRDFYGHSRRTHCRFSPLHRMPPAC